MEAHYGQEAVFYSSRPLSFYYARNCKFALMSCGHYVALAVGHATDAFVSCQVADTILSDRALPRMADLLAGGADAVFLHSLQVSGEAARLVLDRTVRRDDGVLPLTSELCARLVIDNIPKYNFADTKQLPETPLRICWRVGSDGILVHGNHYHPFCLRPDSVRAPLPVDHRSGRQPVHRP